MNENVSPADFPNKDTFGGVVKEADILPRRMTQTPQKKPQSPMLEIKSSIIFQQAHKPEGQPDD
jgi:hypothetical protein